MKKRKRLPVKARMSTYCAAPRSSTLLSERGHMTCSCGWTMLLSKMKQPGESKFITNHCLTVWGVEPVVTHQTSWLESTGVPTKPTNSSAMKQPGESKFFVTNNIRAVQFVVQHYIQYAMLHVPNVTCILLLHSTWTHLLSLVLLAIEMAVGFVMSRCIMFTCVKQSHSKHCPIT